MLPYIVSGNRKEVLVTERDDEMPVTETLLGQFAKELARKLKRLKECDLPPEAAELVDEMLEDATEIYGSTKG